MDAMDWRTSGIRDLPDAGDRAWLAEVAASAGPGRVARIVLRQAPAGPSPTGLRWAAALEACDLSGQGDPLDAPDAVARGTALVDRIRPGWSWAWIHAAPGIAHLHVVAHRHADAALVRLPGPQTASQGPARLLDRLARLLPSPGAYPLGHGREGSAHERIAAERRAESPEGRALLALFPGSTRPRAVIRTDGGAALVALEDQGGVGSPLLLAGLSR